MEEETGPAYGRMGGAWRVCGVSSKFYGCSDNHSAAIKVMDMAVLLARNGAKLSLDTATNRQLATQGGGANKSSDR